MEKVMRLATEKGVVIFTKSSCCMCYAVNILFQDIGVYPVIHEIDKDPEGKEMEKAITKLGCNAPVPAVFIGGRLGWYLLSHCGFSLAHYSTFFAHFLLLKYLYSSLLTISCALPYMVMGNLGKVHMNMLSNFDDGDSSSSSGVKHLDLEEILYGNLLSVNHVVRDPQILEENLRFGLDSVKGDSYLEAR
ncbi:hypothetical protein RYX36_020244 [Vicia faba]